MINSISKMKIQSNSPLQKIPKNYTIDEQSNYWFDIPAGPDTGKRLFYYDYHPKSAEKEVVLFVHGNPECSYTYRHIRDEILRKNTSTRIIAVDHIGFGISDRATYEMIDKHQFYESIFFLKHKRHKSPQKGFHKSLFPLSHF